MKIGGRPHITKLLGSKTLHPHWVNLTLDIQSRGKGGMHPQVFSEFLEEAMDMFGGLLQRQCAELADWNMLLVFLAQSRKSRLLVLPFMWVTHFNFSGPWFPFKNRSQKFLLALSEMWFLSKRMGPAMKTGCYVAHKPLLIFFYICTTPAWHLAMDLAKRHGTSEHSAAPNRNLDAHGYMAELNWSLLSLQKESRMTDSYTPLWQAVEIFPLIWELMQTPGVWNRMFEQWGKLQTSNSILLINFHYGFK